jgi:hypothetical protein
MWEERRKNIWETSSDHAKLNSNGSNDVGLERMTESKIKQAGHETTIAFLGRQGANADRSMRMSSRG